MIAPFSASWWAFLAVVILLLVLCPFLMKNKPRDFKRYFIGIVGIFGIAAFIMYRYGLYADPDYYFNIWDELPLNLCNIAVFIVPIAAFTDIRILQSYCYFGSVVGALAGVSFPDNRFTNVPILSAKGIGFYGTHFLLLFLVLSFVVLGILKPQVKDIFLCLALFGLLAVFAHIVNVVMRATVNPLANYFFTFGVPDSELFAKIYGIIPVPLLYEVLFLPIYGVSSTLLYLPFAISGKLKRIQ